jgi:hypothetical protein
LANLKTQKNVFLDNSLPTYEDVLTEEKEKKKAIEPPSYEEALRMSHLTNSENIGLLRQDSIGLPNVPHTSRAGANAAPIQVKIFFWTFSLCMLIELLSASKFLYLNGFFYLDK